MIISKKDLKRILVNGLPLQEGDPSSSLAKHQAEIERIDPSVYSCYQDDLAKDVLRVFIHGKEVFNLLFENSLCVFRTNMNVEDLALFKEEVYGLILRMSAFEVKRDRRVAPDKKNYSFIGDKIMIKSLTNKISKKDIRAYQIKNKKYRWN